MKKMMITRMRKIKINVKLKDVKFVLINLTKFVSDVILIKPTTTTLANVLLPRWYWKDKMTVYVSKDTSQIPTHPVLS